MRSVFDQGNSMLNNFGNGMEYVNNQKDLNWTNPLSKEEEKELHKGDSAISLDIPREEMLRAKCTHRDPSTKRFTLIHNSDGSVTCARCGATFNLVDNVDIDQIQQIIGGTYDILQTAKLAYIDMTPEAIKSFFIVLPFLQIAPRIYEMAMHTFNKVNMKPNISPNSPSGANMFNNLYSVAANPAMMNPQVFQQMMAAAQMQQQAMMNTGMGGATAVDPASNPMQSKNSGSVGDVKVTTAQFGLN